MNEFKRFIDDCCVTDWRSELPVDDLDTAYRRWCWQHGEKPRSRDLVAEGLVQHGFVRTRRPNGWIWGGVRLSAHSH